MFKENKSLIYFSVVFTLFFIISFFYFLKEKKEIELINLKDYDLLEAIKWIQNNSLEVKVFEKVDFNLPSYQIISQNPPAGTIVKENRKITLVVNSNKINKKFLNFIGNTFNQAQKKIYATYSYNNSIPKITKLNKFSSEHPKGIVIDQTPSPDSIYNQDSEIILIVSKGKMKEKIIVKNYQLKNFRQVENELSNLGIFVKAKFKPTTKNKNIGKIFKQNIKPGEVLTPEDEIIFLVAADINKNEQDNQHNIEILRIAQFRIPNSTLTNNLVTLLVKDSLGSKKQFENNFAKNSFLEIPYTTIGKGKLDILINNEIFKTVEF